MQKDRIAHAPSELDTGGITSTFASGFTKVKSVRVDAAVACTARWPVDWDNTIPAVMRKGMVR